MRSIRNFGKLNLPLEGRFDKGERAYQGNRKLSRTLSPGHGIDPVKSRERPVLPGGKILQTHNLLCGIEGNRSIGMTLVTTGSVVDKQRKEGRHLRLGHLETIGGENLAPVFREQARTSSQSLKPILRLI